MKAPPAPRQRKKPVSPAKQLVAELWAARLGFCGESQLDKLPACVDGIPTQFEYHSFRFIDHKEQVRIWKKAAQRVARKMPLCGQRFYADFGFLALFGN